MNFDLYMTSETFTKFRCSTWALRLIIQDTSKPLTELTAEEKQELRILLDRRLSALNLLSPNSPLPPELSSMSSEKAQ
jgi:hypothetical protein